MSVEPEDPSPKPSWSGREAEALAGWLGPSFGLIGVAVLVLLLLTSHVIQTLLWIMWLFVALFVAGVITVAAQLLQLL